jgi:hypothetical protein
MPGLVSVVLWQLGIHQLINPQVVPSPLNKCYAQLSTFDSTISGLPLVSISALAIWHQSKFS